jgi:hypothetical protein
MLATDVFAWGVFTTLVLMFGTFVAIGLWFPRHTGEITDKHNNRVLGIQMTIEEQDVPMMFAALNDRRAKRGLPPIIEAEFRAEIGRRQLRALDDDRHRRRGARRERRGF